MPQEGEGPGQTAVLDRRPPGVPAPTPDSLGTPVREPSLVRLSPDPITDSAPPTDEPDPASSESEDDAGDPVDQEDSPEDERRRVEQAQKVKDVVSAVFASKKATLEGLTDAEQEEVFRNDPVLANFRTAEKYSTHITEEQFGKDFPTEDSKKAGDQPVDFVHGGRTLRVLSVTGKNADGTLQVEYSSDPKNPKAEPEPEPMSLDPETLRNAMLFAEAKSMKAAVKGNPDQAAVFDHYFRSIDPKKTENPEYSPTLDKQADRVTEQLTASAPEDEAKTSDLSPEQQQSAEHLAQAKAAIEVQMKGIEERIEHLGEEEQREASLVFAELQMASKAASKDGVHRVLLMNHALKRAEGIAGKQTHLESAAREATKRLLPLVKESSGSLTEMIGSAGFSPEKLEEINGKLGSADGLLQVIGDPEVLDKMPSLVKDIFGDMPENEVQSLFNDVMDALPEDKKRDLMKYAKTGGKGLLLALLILVGAAALTAAGVAMTAKSS